VSDELTVRLFVPENLLCHVNTSQHAILLNLQNCRSFYICRNTAQGGVITVTNILLQSCIHQFVQSLIKVFYHAYKINRWLIGFLMDWISFFQKLFTFWFYPPSRSSEEIWRNENKTATESSVAVG
jgi:hypothetical protein